MYSRVKIPHLVVKCLIRSKTVVILPPFAAICPVLPDKGRLSRSSRSVAVANKQYLWHNKIPQKVAINGVLRRAAFCKLVIISRILVFRLKTLHYFLPNVGMNVGIKRPDFASIPTFKKSHFSMFFK